MATIVSICNLALRYINADPITLISESTDRARFMNGVFADVRDSCLRELPWNFSITRATLAQDGTGPLMGFTYSYALPTSPYCLRVLQLNDDDSLEWAVEGRKLFTDEGTAQIKYIAQITDPASFDALFTEALAFKLASLAAYPLAKKLELQREYRNQYIATIQRAKALNLIENAEVQDENLTNPLKMVR
jgi:hypothetical protein